MELFLFDHEERPIGSLSKRAGNLRSCWLTQEINGEHSLSIGTTRHLEPGTVALFELDGEWHEMVVDEAPENHEGGPHAIGSYHLIWSLQHDLRGVNAGDVQQPGMHRPASAGVAMRSALVGTTRWMPSADAGITVTSGALMAFDSAWDRLNTVVKYWGGEVEAQIVVQGGRVVYRIVRLARHVGSEMATRRLEWRRDLTSIGRDPEPGPYFCGILPLGSGEQEYAEDDETTYEDKLTIEGVTGSKYLYDERSKLLFRRPARGGGWEYPVTRVDYQTDDEQELLALAREDLHAHTRPKVTYTGTVSQFAEAGMNVCGIALGDEVQVVDLGFNEDAPLRVQERVLRVERDLLGVEDTRLTIGKLQQTLERTMSNVIKAVGPQMVAVVAPEYVKPDYAISVPEHPTYTITTPEGTYTAPTTYAAANYTAPDFSSYLDQINARADDLEAVVAGSMRTSDGQVTLGGDGWEHQIDGVKVDHAVVNFVTADTSSTTPVTPVVTPEDARREAQSWGQVNPAARGTYSAADRVSTRASSKINVTAANIAGSRQVDPNNVWGTHVDEATGRKMDERGVLFVSL